MKYLVIILLSLTAFAYQATPAGEEVKPTEIESAHLAQYRAQLDRADAQIQLLQTQANQVLAARQQAQAAFDTLVKDVTARIKKERKLDVVYDPRTGDGGTFRVAPTPEVTKEKK